MKNYTTKELKAMSTEELIFQLVLCNGADDRGSKSAKKHEEKIFKILEERNIISYNNMKNVYEKAMVW